MLNPARRGAAVLLGCLTLTACEPPESREAAEARTLKAVYENQIAGLEDLRARAERGEDVLDKSLLAVSIDETAVKTLIVATLPPEVKLGERVALRLEKTEAYFRHTQAVVVFEGRLISADLHGAFVQVSLAGGLDKVTFDEGRLTTRVKLYQARVQDTSLGNIAAGAMGKLVSAHLGDIEDAIPAIEVPVRLDQSIELGGLEHGPVTVGPGALPLQVSVERILPNGQRLWVLLKVATGPWRRGKPVAAPAAEKKP